MSDKTLVNKKILIKPADRSQMKSTTIGEKKNRKGLMRFWKKLLAQGIAALLKRRKPCCFSRATKIIANEAYKDI
jgi:hypothetical protein